MTHNSKSPGEKIARNTSINRLNGPVDLLISRMKAFIDTLKQETQQNLGQKLSAQKQQGNIPELLSAGESREK
jgi:hypothetical protein